MQTIVGVLQTPLLIQKRAVNTKQAMGAQTGAGYTGWYVFSVFSVEFSNHSTLSGLILL